MSCKSQAVTRLDAGLKPSKAEEVRELDEKLLGVVDEASAGANEFGGVGGQVGTALAGDARPFTQKEVLRVAVISDVKRSARIHQISN